MPTTAPTTMKMEAPFSVWDVVAGIMHTLGIIWNAFPWWGKILVVVAIIWRISLDVRKR